jgi:hypothetical protein
MCQLLTEIEYCRNRMIEFAEKYGYHANQTVVISQYLDILLNLYSNPTSAHFGFKNLD